MPLVLISFVILIRPAETVNVAGTSQYLDPEGEDVLGINSPLKEFQAGTFETTYLDNTLRISRTNMGPVDQLRVYVRSEKEELSDDYLDEEYFDEFDSFGQEDDEDDVVDADIVEDDVSPSDS
jgi:PAP_fibrillin